MKKSAWRVPQPAVGDKAGGDKPAPAWFEPRVGWERACQRLAAGRCPFCGNRMLNVSVCLRDGLTWACIEGCNP